MKSFPFTSDGGDRKVYTKDFRALFSKYFTNGVFNGGFAVTPATGMKVNVSAGACNINGVFAYNDDNNEMPIETVSSETYFNIVLRLDDNKATRNIEIYVVKGTSTPPELTRNETVYELCIARIKVGANNQSITLSMIEDTRLNTDLCGIVANAVETLDTDTYYNQLQGKLDEVIDIVDQALDETLAGNLQNQINNYWETIYKIGDIYITTNEDDPNVRFGGTWVKWGEGKTIVGVNADDADFNTVEKTGGEKTHKLTLTESYWTTQGGNPINTQDGGNRGYLVAHDDTRQQAFNIQQEYITCYFWKRVE